MDLSRRLWNQTDICNAVLLINKLYKDANRANLEKLKAEGKELPKGFSYLALGSEISSRKEFQNDLENFTFDIVDFRWTWLFESI